MKITRLVTVCLTTGLLLMVATASGGIAANERKEGPRRLSLNDAINLAMEKNPDLALAREAVEKARVGEEQARSAADALPSEMVMSLDQAKIKELYPRQAAGGVRLAEKGEQTARDNLRLGIEQAYFGTQLAGEMVRVREQAVELAATQAEQARLAYKVGTRARADVLAAEAQLAAAQAELASAKKALAVAEMELNRAIGLPLDTLLELTTELGEIDRHLLPAKDMEAVAKDIARALTRSINVIKAEEERDIAKLNFDLTARYYTPNVYAYRQAEADYHQAQVRLEKERTAAELEVRKTLLDIDEALARIEQQKKAVSLSEEAARLADLRYRAGVGTISEVLDAQVRLSGTRSALANAVFSLNKAFAQYKNLVGE